MSADSWFEFIKILGIASTALLGSIGVLGDFRTADKTRVSKYGYWMIAGIVVSGTLTIIATAHDDHTLDQRLSDQMAANNRSLRALYRLQAPFGQFQSYFVLTLPQTEPSVSQYIARIKPEIQEILKEPETITDKLRPSYVSMSKGAAPQVISIQRGSSLYPSGGELVLEPLVSRLNLAVYFYSAETNCCDIHKSDLMEVGYAFESHPSFQLDLGTWELKITGSYKYKVARTNGLVGSIPDLLGATLVIEPLVAPVVGDSGDPAKALIAASSVNVFALTVADGKQLWFRDQGLSRRRDLGSGLFLAAKLPSSERDFSTLFDPKKTAQQTQWQ